jgi:hypothetical protein
VLTSERVGFDDPVSRALNTQMQAQTGIGTIRFPFDWDKVETEPGVYDFSRYDLVVGDAALHGMKVLPTLIGAPAWRNSAPPVNPQRGVYPPARPAEMGELAVVFVNRYGPDGSFWTEHPDLPYVPIRAWQVWNEPNVDFFWPGGVDPAAYVDLLRATGSAIKAADPGAEIVTAGIPNSNGWTVGRWLDAMYAAGAQGTFDTFASHPYGADSSEVMDRLREARAALDAHGDPRPIWVTEFGWATAGEPSRFTVTEDGQALRIKSALDAFAAERDSLRLRGFIYFHWRDSQNGTLPGTGLWSAYTGLLAGDGRAKPGYGAFASAVREHWGAPPPPPAAADGFGAPGAGTAGQPAAADGAADDREWRHGSADGPAPPAAGAFTGVSADDVFGDDPRVRDDALEHQRAAGVQVIRHPFRWRAIETNAGRYSFAHYDDVVLSAARHGVGVVPAVGGAPAFRRGREAGGARGLATALARRYGPGGSLWSENPSVPARPIRTWEFARKGDAPAYARELGQAGAGLRGVDRGTELVAAAPSARFLAAMYAAPGRPAWDSAGVSAWARSPSAVVARLTAVRRVLNAHSHRGAGLWLTGTGWATEGARGPLRVGSGGQARRISALFGTLGKRRRVLGLRGVIYQGWRDTARGGPGPRGELTGLVAADGRNKRGLRAFAAAAAAAQQRS